MNALLSYADVSHLIGIKLIFFVFLAAGVVGIYKKWKPMFFLSLFGVSAALAYYLLVRGMLLTLWGLQGDEITISGMYEMFAEGSMRSDFAYPALPPFYPPLFFWLWGLVGRVADWNGVQTAKAAVLGTLLAYPLAFYLIQKWYWRRGKDAPGAPGTITFFLSSLFLFAIIDTDGIITKPYELISASLTVLWAVFLQRELAQARRRGATLILLGVSGGALFALFYFWFFLAAIGIALYNLWTPPAQRVRYYGSLFVVAVLTLVSSAPYWFPLAKAYVALGSENWQPGFFWIKAIATTGPFFEPTLRGALALGGFGALIFLRQRFFARMLLSLFAASYAWHLMGLVTVLVAKTPLQEAKGFFFWNGAILALGAAYGAEVLWQRLCARYGSPAWQRPALILGFLLLAPLFIFGFFADDPVVQARRAVSRQFSRPGILELIRYLRTRGDAYQTVTLHSGITELQSFLPMNHFAYFNQHNSHPAAHFSTRLAFVRELSLAKDARAFHALGARNDVAPIERYIFNKNRRQTYDIYFHLDNFPDRIREEAVRIPKKLFDAAYFSVAYENDEVIVYEPRSL